MTYKELALKLCDGYLDMPSGCDGCPLCIENYDDDGNMICMLNDTIDEAPTVDAIPVVRCENCKYAETDRIGCYCILHDDRVAENGFCSYGERRQAK